MSLFDVTTGMIHVAYEPVTLEGSFDEEGRPLKEIKIKQAKVGREAEYVDESPCKPCPDRAGCKIECVSFKTYVRNPAKYFKMIKESV
jgi:hypothetical protein